ncbi:Protein of unknown function [Alteromonadaceae bacterium Bs31]|nr:Protein of unknown function [Alteromonadaceae bacterium Bs31]
MSIPKLSIIILVSLGVCSPFASASEPVPEKAALETAFQKKHFSPYTNSNYPTEVLWGDTHVHTALSMDAGAFGNQLSPDDAYRFAKGEKVRASTGTEVKLSRPLDWMAVADQSDNLGLFTLLYQGDASFLMRAEINKRLSEKIQQGGEEGVEAALHIMENYANGELESSLNIAPDSTAYKRVWHQIVDTAEIHNAPGHFTAFIGYEWAALSKGNSLNRVVLYRDGADYARAQLPYTTTPPQGSAKPRDLWQWMEAYENKTGGDVLAIAHNGNLSNGKMFPEKQQADGKGLNKHYVQQRAKWEPLYEVTQIKGDGEAHPGLSPTDEFADYETWEMGNHNLSSVKQDSMLAGEYAREGLKRGLKLQQKFARNPYKFGMIGSTGSHTSLATAQEDNFFGKHSGAEPGPKRWKHLLGGDGDLKVVGWQQVASGLSAVWAKENTREAIFDAMERKEVYATSGSRMSVRFFGGWDFTQADIYSRNPAIAGYRKGVSMGGELAVAPAGKAPSFLVAAVKDPYSGNLDRIQIIKGWLDSKGELHERVFDVAVSDNRKIEANGRCKTPVGSTVDVLNASWTNTIGEAEMITVWKDPDFDPRETAFYYTRVIEIPTPRWTAYEAKRYGIEMDKQVPMTTQERAYTSPIWYTP